MTERTPGPPGTEPAFGPDVEPPAVDVPLLGPSSGRSIGHRWRSTTLPYLLLRGGGQAAEFVGWLLLARRLGSTGFGELSVAVLICRYGGLVADWGASIRGVRDVAGGRSAATMKRLDRRRTATTAGLSVVYVAGCFAFGQSDLAPLVLMLVGIGLNRDWIALGQERGARSALPTAVQGVLLAVLAVSVTTDAIAVPVAIAYGMGLVLSLALNRLPKGDDPLVVASSHATDDDHVDGWMLQAVVSNQILSSADTFLIAAMLSASAAGVYSAVYRIPNGWLALLIIVRGGLLPMATSLLHTDTSQFRQLYRSSLRWGLRSALLLVALTPVFYFLIPVLYGQEYDSGQWPAVILLLATAVATAAAPLHHLFLAFGDDRPYAWYLTGAAVLNVVLNVALIPVFELVGAAFATLAAHCFMAGVLWWAVRIRMRGLDETLGADAASAQEAAG